MRSQTVRPWRLKDRWPDINQQIARMGADSRHHPEPIRWQRLLTTDETAAAIELARRDPRGVVSGWRSPLAVVVDRLLRDARDPAEIGQVARRALRLMVERMGQHEDKGDDADRNDAEREAP